jgi:transketolase
MGNGRKISNYYATIPLASCRVFRLSSSFCHPYKIMNQQIDQLLKELIVEKLEQKIADRLQEHFHPEDYAKIGKQQMDSVEKEWMARKSKERSDLTRLMRQRPKHNFAIFLGILAALHHHYANQRKQNRLLNMIHQHQKNQQTTAALTPPPYTPAEFDKPFSQRHFGGKKASDVFGNRNGR